MFEKASLNDLEAFGIGHAQDIDAGCGCSVIVAPAGAVCGVDVRGGAPATRETDLLKPENMVQDIHAVVLSGGSAFGLEASCGVTEELAHKHIGFHLEDVHVPIVVSACLFDLTLGKNTWPNKEMGVCATRDAFSHMKSKNKKESQSFI